MKKEKEETVVSEQQEAPKEVLEVDGIRYTIIGVNNLDDGSVKNIRLFEHLSAARLEFEEWDEYKVRRMYMEEYYKVKRKGKVAWPSLSFGTLTKERAAQVLQMINEQQKQKEENGK